MQSWMRKIRGLVGLVCLECCSCTACLKAGAYLNGRDLDVVRCNRMVFWRYVHVKNLADSRWVETLLLRCMLEKAAHLLGRDLGVLDTLPSEQDCSSVWVELGDTMSTSASCWWTRQSFDID